MYYVLRGVHVRCEAACVGITQSKAWRSWPDAAATKIKQNDNRHISPHIQTHTHRHATTHSHSEDGKPSIEQNKKQTLHHPSRIAGPAEPRAAPRSPARCPVQEGGARRTPLCVFLYSIPIKIHGLPTTNCCSSPPHPPCPPPPHHLPLR